MLCVSAAIRWFSSANQIVATARMMVAISRVYSKIHEEPRRSMKGSLPTRVYVGKTALTLRLLFGDDGRTSHRCTPIGADTARCLRPQILRGRVCELDTTCSRL